MLRVRIISFSYLRSGIPKDETANGGGFVFDCRAVENPGRFPQLMPLTGCDEPVMQLLQKDDEMNRFLKNVYEIVDLTVDKYLLRGYTDLMVCFGCTGGKHRSVYAAQTLKEHLAQKYDDAVSLILSHRDLGIKS